jgi:protein-L-isoaspartate(D-aspartate) O-methyltransferase
MVVRGERRSSVGAGCDGPSAAPGQRRVAWRRVASPWHPAWLAGLVIGLVALLLLTAVRGRQEDKPEAPTGAPSQPATQAATTGPAEQSPLVRRGEDGRLQWPRPRIADRQAERDRMVDTQIARGGVFQDAVADPRVLAAMRAVPRHEFVPDRRRGQAYDDTPLPIGYGQTISQPYVVALMTEVLQVQEGHRVLEIGTGSGYQAAVLSELTPYVYTIEILKPLYEQSFERFARLGYRTIRVRLGDGYDGWPEQAPFDEIIVTCAAGHVPPPLWDQLRPGGRMVIPIGGVYETQRLLVLTKQPDGSRTSRNVLPVRFVPMTGKIEKP